MNSVYPIDTTLQSHAICQGSNYNFYGTPITTSGIYYHTLISSHGCDSIITADITVNPVFSSNNPQIICNGVSYVFNGHTYTIAGNYYDTLTTIHGCDSIVTTQLTVNPSFQLIIRKQFAMAALIFSTVILIQLQEITMIHLSTVHGCDSIIITQLTVNPAFSVNNPQTICTGGSYVFNGHTYTTTGNYYDSLTTVHGCDSVLELSLIVYPIDTTLQSHAICQGSNYNFYGTFNNSSGLILSYFNFFEWLRQCYYC